MNIAVLIPARYGSSRFEGKVIKTILQKPMVQWVYEGVKSSKYANFLAVLTDDDRVFETVRAFGGNVYFVKGDFKSGTDRIAEFCRDKDFDYIVNMQADEPLIDSDTIDKLIETVILTKEEMATLVCSCSEDEIDDENVVKVVVDKMDYAMYFSRSRIPFNRNYFNRYLKHIGIYAYSKKTLLRLASEEATELEKAEGLEQLRALQYGIKIKIGYVDKFLIGVDTKDDLKKVEEYLSKNDKS
ncbi:3-deoxy-manno-octulosonate cytidylyltransferase [Hippea maritima]|uniref:3-deoxy-manno-octulosonate cytidylyltransferase n=1 Tax=Hippea maritima (strain ATCC 700847 / DSM 10411 / MH2) TaxID=760142 RepID=F2LTS3_HIPMA|nr:3-deoxy-manno-octulosonate cytidylyltransferase [Hippea maritima]AEA34449.1 3-deoxy-manno-octulosonate cytidylyltransferase [Hippea maritima DSM 10411]